jgi:putative SOS response-associated peptidase YedK
VPVSSYCEPNGEKPAKWVWFALKGKEERPLYAFSGIWRTWKGPIKKDGPTVDLDVYAFMTTEPNELTRSIDHERMPALLDGEVAFDTWLRGSSKEAYGLVPETLPIPCSECGGRLKFKLAMIPSEE